MATGTSYDVCSRIHLPLYSAPSTLTSTLDFQTSPDKLSNDKLVEQIKLFKLAIENHLTEAMDKRSFMYGAARETLQRAPRSEMEHFLDTAFPEAPALGNSVPVVKQVIDQERTKLPLVKETESGSGSISPMEFSEKIFGLLSLPKEQTRRAMLEFRSLLQRSKEIETEKQSCFATLERIQSEQAMRSKLANFPARKLEIDLLHQQEEMVANEMEQISSQIQTLTTSILTLANKLSKGKGDKVVIKQKKAEMEKKRTGLNQDLLSLKKKYGELENSLITLNLSLRIDSAAIEKGQKLDKKRTDELKSKIEKLSEEEVEVSNGIRKICETLSEHLVVKDIDDKLDAMRSRYAALTQEFLRR
ncbi:MAG: hypothetical protein JSS60_03695 [Verrucomicrobia bacterium]|nr:hypothetical protein [Verrucomicrobiota bacterium]